MPIKIPNDLPSTDILLDEGVALMREQDAVRQDIRPLQIALLNLMPEKVKTETQLIRQLGRTPLQIELTLLTTGSYEATNAPQGHMAARARGRITGPWGDRPGTVRHHRFVAALEPHGRNRRWQACH